MKKLFLNCAFLGTSALAMVACGGSTKVSNAVNDANTAIDGANDALDNATLESNASKALQDSSWSDKTAGTLDSTNSVPVSTNVQNAVSSVVTQATAGVSITKKNKTETISSTINGPLGGTATITGTYTINTAGSAVYPIDYAYDFKVVFNNYQDSTISINGEVTYKGTASATDSSNTKTTIDVDGGYSVLYQDTAYTLVTNIHAEITVTNLSSIAVTYSYTVNGTTYSGTYNLGS